MLGRKKWMVWLLVLSLLGGLLSACGGAKKDPYIGKWVCVEANLDGEKVLIKDNPYMKIIVEFLDGGKANFETDGEPMTVTWKKDGEKRVVQAVGVDIRFELKGDKLLCSDFGGFDMTLARDSSPEGKAALDALVKFAAGQSSEPATSAPSSTVTTTTRQSPTTASAAPAPAGQSALEEKWLCDWYGYLDISTEGEKPAEINSETVDAWASIFLDKSTNRYVFEVYLDENTDEPFMSMFVKLAEDHIEAEIGDGDAWVYQRDLTPDEAHIFWLPLTKEGFLPLNYDYVDPDDESDKASLTLYLRRYGDLWENERNLPPGFDAYKAGLASGTAPTLSAATQTTAGGQSGGLSSSLQTLLTSAKFSGPTKSFSNGGLTLTFPQGAEAKAGLFGGVDVDVHEIKGWMATVMSKQENFYSNLQEEKKLLKETYGSAQEFKIEELKLNGASGFVLASGNDGLMEASVWLFLYPDTKKRIVVNVGLVSGSLQELLADQDVLATMASIKW